MLKPPTTAFVLGAGLGTRLRPWTADCPKPLLPLGGRPMVTRAFDHLIEAGIRRILVNTHHAAQRWPEAFPDATYRGIPLVFRHEPVLLETGGGIKNIQDLLEPDEPLLIYNGDILTDLPLAKLIEHHAAHPAESTLVLRQSGEPRKVSLDTAGKITDFRRTEPTPGERLCLFTGIYLIEPSLLDRIPPGEIVSIIPIWQQCIRDGHPPRGVVINEGRWHDLGTPEEYQLINQSLS
ncbi:MAG: nucleotidyltransferase family protein [Candidatus Methylacidiphilales bacterium]|nr:nucleotidyltransferase family protein [Candidatus Methylacidiphilales bacterium]